MLKHIKNNEITDGTTRFDECESKTATLLLSGKTIRRGWISSGKDTANAGLKHIEHAHGE